MTDRGRHARRSGIGFYKDVLFLVAGILIVGAVVFGGLSLWAGRNNEDPPVSSSTSATAADDTTTSTTTPTTQRPATTSSTSTTTATSTTASSAPPTTLRPARQPSEVRVVVLNSTSVTGLAAGLSDELSELGYVVSEPSNYTPELADTMIFHADGFSLEALALSDTAVEGVVASDPALTASHGVDIVVVLGLSYQE